MIRALSLLLVLSACRNPVEDTPKDPIDTAAPYIDQDGDGFSVDEGDCNDQDASIAPDADESCDELDNDCDGEVDEGVLEPFYADADADGYGDPLGAVEACELPSGYVEDATDCDDGDPEVHPDAPERCNGVDDDCDDSIDEDVQELWYQDRDGDGWGDGDLPLEACDPGSGFVVEAGDCDDLVASTHPEATELCNGVDDDCDDEVDEGLVATWYDDADGDGYGDPDSAVETCEPGSEQVTDATDCDDLDPASHPDAVETCDLADNDCDGVVDEDVTATWYPDDDGDGWGDATAAVEACTAPSGHTALSGDCDDADSAVSPLAAELCNGVDDDCDGSVDEDSALDVSTWYADADGDGYGDPDSILVACEAPSGHVADATDCDDGAAAVNPDATEVCDGIDNDCDGVIDPDSAVDADTWYLDADGDGYGNALATTTACSMPSGHVADATDCDDGDAGANPGATEICDGDDNDCDGSVDEGLSQTWYLDWDMDGYGDDARTVEGCAAPSSDYVDVGGDCDDGSTDYHPGASEGCDGEDYDCDGAVDSDADGDGYADAACGGDDCDDGDASLYPEASGGCAVGTSCLDILDQGRSSGDGSYTIDVDGYETGEDPFAVHCDMSTDGGGWTLVASFSNDDGAYLWTQYDVDTSYLSSWTDESVFGDLADHTLYDYKSEAFWLVDDATDLLAVDSGANWASYDDALTGSLLDTLSAYSSCQTSVLSGITVDSSDATMAAYGQLVYYGGDPNNSDHCAFGYSTSATDSSVIGLAGTGCGTAGFGHVGWWTGTEHSDADSMFCLEGGVVPNTDYSCGTWHGVEMVGWFDEDQCDYSLLYVR